MARRSLLAAVVRHKVRRAEQEDHARHQGRIRAAREAERERRQAARQVARDDAASRREFKATTPKLADVKVKGVKSVKAKPPGGRIKMQRNGNPPGEAA